MERTNSIDIGQHNSENVKTIHKVMNTQNINSAKQSQTLEGEKCKDRGPLREIVMLLRSRVEEVHPTKKNSEKNSDYELLFSEEVEPELFAL